MVAVCGHLQSTSRLAAGRSCLDRWTNIADTLAIAKTKTLLRPSEWRDDRILDVEDIQSPIDPELQAEWRRFSSLGKVEESEEMFWSNEETQREFPRLCRLVEL